MLSNFRMNFLVFFVLFIFISTASGEEERMKLPYPDHYFAVDDTKYNDHPKRVWYILFPENPEFKYSFLYLPSFEKHVGFYIENNNLHWAICTRGVGYEDYGNLINLNDIGTSSVWGDVLEYIFPYLEIEHSAKFHAEIVGKKSPPYIGLSVSMPSPVLYYYCLVKLNLRLRNTISSWFYVKRGEVKLEAKIAEELRKTWDLAVAERTVKMDLYRQFLNGFDGNFSYYRGGYGDIGEDIWCGDSKMRRGMSELSFFLINRADNGSFNEEDLLFIRDKCKNIQKIVLDVSVDPPPMISDEWTSKFLNSYFRYRDRQDSKPVSETPSVEDNPENDAGNSSEVERPNAEKMKQKIDQIKEFHRRFLVPPDRNEVWKGFLPSSTPEPGVPGFLILTRDDGSWAFSLKEGIAMTASYEPRNEGRNMETTEKGTDLKITNPFVTDVEGVDVALRIRRDYDNVPFVERKKLRAILETIPNHLSPHPEIDFNTDDYPNFDGYYSLVISVNSEGKIGYLVANKDSTDEYIRILYELVTNYHYYFTEEDRIKRLQSIEEELTILSELISK